MTDAQPAHLSMPHDHGWHRRASEGARRGKTLDAGRRDPVRTEAWMALMFLNGGGMRGGPVHLYIDGVPLVADVDAAAP